ncbi:TetR family transcriptional regulator [Actinospica durhamensis]|uniref:TetR family transcriptional regulator n=1 Tax=Actinospica durhamensis TaxID=1508375 RepID=A0A941EQ66_9ACTN|nr:TetR/AcrR family transcriptional regulator [Actinospica durhamensis]MBR7834517.1 TetR family transcriptional regulator [Actinospica durhamensis]
MTRTRHGGGSAGAAEISGDRRRLRSRETRHAISTAAADLVLERGLGAVGVEDIAERAHVVRRTFSRHFAGKEEAVLDATRDDGVRINQALRARPASEPPLTAYRAAVDEWLAEHELLDAVAYTRWRDLVRLTEREPTLFAAYERIRVDAQDESVAVLAERMGCDAESDFRPALVVWAAAGALTAALRAWARQEHDQAAGLRAWVRQAYGALVIQVAADAAAGSGEVSSAGEGA